MNQNLLHLTRALQGVSHISVSELHSYVRGVMTDAVLKKNLYKDPYFGIFSHLEQKEVLAMQETAMQEGLLQLKDQSIFLTQKGADYSKSGKIAEQIIKYETTISAEENKRIKETEEFLGELNTEQKKAIVCERKTIACIAGAGSGKTTVLTKRIQYLISKKKVNSESILAITFTRKARLNMKEKLESQGVKGVKIHTFNSFCETLLRKYNNLAYNKPTTLISYSEKIKAITQAMKLLSINFDREILQYFSKQQQKQLTTIQMKQKYMNDCFTIKDYFTNNNKTIQPFYKNIRENIDVAQNMYAVIKYIESYMKKHGFRDFADQLFDAIQLLKTHPKIAPQFEHILIDEYQDINTIQKELIDQLAPNNIFIVGDPRQAIYGWRGSKVEYITNIKGEQIYLTKNYRCAKHILSLGNAIIKKMELPDLESANATNGTIQYTKYATKLDEAYAVAKNIKLSPTPHNEIFVIARTNKALEEMSNALTKIQIPHVVKNEYSMDTKEVHCVTLMTAHCAKGLEAEEVYIIGCNANMFPCIKSESNVIEFVKDYYNRKEEELRLLYVAITRAKKKVFLSSWGKTMSPFLKEQKSILKKTIAKKQNTLSREMLVNRRTQISKRLTIPQNLVLSDDDINQILVYQPNTIADLKDIIGSSKANRFGKKILGN